MQRRGVTVSLVACLVLLAAPLTSAPAISIVAGPTTTLSHEYVGDTGSYTFSGYTTDNERATGVSITFPEGFGLTGAVAIEPAGTVAASGQTLTIMFTEMIPPRTEFSVSIGGVVNGAAGTHELPPMTVYRYHQRQDRELDPDTTSAVIAPFLIGEPWLSLTLSTGALDFDLYPEVASPAQSVDVTIDSSHDYTIVREASGEGDLFGLAVNGAAEGPKGAGVATFTDTYSADVPWTTEGDRVYAATYTYTVVQ